jgi:uncharacterized protein YjbJ (UPF0337 family)
MSSVEWGTTYRVVGRFVGLRVRRTGSPETRKREEPTVEKDRIEGKAKEVEGKITGDESREAEGRAQGNWGELKEKAKDAWEDVKDKAGEAYNEREERKEREKAAQRR